MVFTEGAGRREGGERRQSMNSLISLLKKKQHSNERHVTYITDEQTFPAHLKPTYTPI